MTDDADANLVAAALRGDAESFSRLCERHYPALVAIAYSRLAERHLAQDAAQETLLAAYRDIAKLKKPEQFAGWLAAICRNVASDMAKARARACEKHAGIADCVDLVDRTDPADAESDIVVAVREIVRQLEPDVRDIIYLRYYNQMGYDQIARMLGVSEEAVNGKLRRARASIRLQLQRRRSMEIEP